MSTETGQLQPAFQLLKSNAEFPRKAMTSPFFWRGVRTDEDDLVLAMDVVGDYLVAEYGSRDARERAQSELALIKRLETCSAQPRDRCAALWTLLITGEDEEANALLSTGTEPAGTASSV